MSTEKPEHVLAFQLPHVPHVVVAEIQVAIERKREAIYAAALLDVAQGFVNVFPAEGQEQIGQHFFNQFLGQYRSELTFSGHKQRSRMGVI
jgi:hypothetical protein